MVGFEVGFSMFENVCSLSRGEVGREGEESGRSERLHTDKTWNTKKGRLPVAGKVARPNANTKPTEFRQTLESKLYTCGNLSAPNPCAPLPVFYLNGGHRSAWKKELS